MKNLKLFLIILVIFSSIRSFSQTCKAFGSTGLSAYEAHTVEGYQAIYMACSFEDSEVLALRSLNLDGEQVSLVVHPENSQTSLMFSSCLLNCRDVDENYFSETHYGANYLDSFLSPYPLTNDGLVQGVSNKTVALTIDMCPSSRGFSQQVYDRLEDLSTTNNAAIPVGVAMTRRWLKRWPNEFKQIKQLHKSGQLKVEWINHSANHRYDFKTPLEQNFLLMPDTNMEDEVLGNEVSLISNGVTPSIYFRFPGLVSDFDTINYVANLGLITLGSNAWLAKGEAPKFGSIILIHGNKNEVVGEKKLITYIERMKSLGHEFGSLFDIFN